jgi:hypothetical protein
MRRTSSTERMDSDFLRLRESWCRLVEDVGLQFTLWFYRQVEQGELCAAGIACWSGPDRVRSGGTSPDYARIRGAGRDIDRRR